MRISRRIDGAERETQESYHKGLEDGVAIPDARKSCQNLPFATVWQRAFCRWKIRFMKQNKLDLLKWVTDHQVNPDWKEETGLTLFEETLDQLTKPAKHHFAERKPISYDQLDHPRYGLLDKAHDKLSRKTSSFQSWITQLDACDLSLYKVEMGLHHRWRGQGGLSEEYRWKYCLCWPEPAATPSALYLWISCRMILASQGKNGTGGSGRLSGRVRGKSIYPAWTSYLDGRGEVESGIYEMCDMLAQPRKFLSKKYRAELAIMMSCKESIQGQPWQWWPFGQTAPCQLSQCI